MNEKNEKKTWINIRATASLIITLSFIVIVISGLVLYFSPRGRVANWSGWMMMGVGKEDWGAVHTTLGLLMVVGVGFHVFYNWKIIVRYFKMPFAERKRSHREVATAVLVTLVVFIGTLFGWPPFSAVDSIKHSAKDYWEKAEVRSPYAHAEEDTLEVFADNLGRPLDELLERLEEKGFEAQSPAITVGELADKFDATPNDIFSALSMRGQSQGRGRGGRQGSGQGGEQDCEHGSEHGSEQGSEQDYEQGWSQGGGQGRGQGGGGQVWQDSGQGRGQGGQGRGQGGQGMGQGGVQDWQGDSRVGYGRQTLVQICEENDIRLSVALKALETEGVTASAGDNMRNIADRIGMNPGEVASLIGIDADH